MEKENNNPNQFYGFFHAKASPVKCELKSVAKIDFYFI